MKFIFKILIVLVITSLYSCKSDYTSITKEINSNLVLANQIDNETGELIGKSDTFVIMDKGNVEAKLDLSTYFANADDKLLIHLDWVDEKGNSFYKKSKLVTKKDPILNSSISISPKLRQAGNYTINVYIFRELVFSKTFKLLPVFTPNTIPKERIKLELKANKKTVKLKTNNPKIYQMPDKWLNASVNLKNIPKTDVSELLYQINWVDSDGKTFYKKYFSVASKSKKNKLSSAIEIAPGKKDVGHYKVQLLLFDKLLSEKNFEIKPALDVHKIKVKEVILEDANKTNNKENVFKITDKNKLKVSFKLENCLAFTKNNYLNFKIVWKGLNGKTFYTKRFNFKPKDHQKVLKSSISITDKKRKKGHYKVQLYLFNKIVSEKDFILE